jgi:RNA polymerase sigma-70 factor, ECF subfamily
LTAAAGAPILRPMPAPPPPPDDLGLTLQLVRRAQAGDHAALQPLFDRYYDRVRRIVRLRLGGGLRSRLESADIVQETFLAALAGFDRFEVRSEASLLQWLAVLAENRIRDAADWHGAGKRDAGREVPLSLPGRSGTVHLDPAASGMAPADGVAHDEQVEALEAAVAELPEPERELVVLRDYVGMSWEDVAARTGRVSAAAARMAHGKVLLSLGAKLRAGRASG